MKSETHSLFKMENASVTVGGLVLSEFGRWHSMPTNYNGGCWGRCAFDWTAFSNHQVEIVFSRLWLTESEHRVVCGLNS